MRISTHLPALLHLLSSSRLESLITPYKQTLQNEHSKGHRIFTNPPKLSYPPPFSISAANTFLC